MSAALFLAEAGGALRRFRMDTYEQHGLDEHLATVLIACGLPTRSKVIGRSLQRLPCQRPITLSRCRTPTMREKGTSEELHLPHLLPRTWYRSSELHPMPSRKVWEILSQRLTNSHSPDNRIPICLDLEVASG